MLLLRSWGSRRYDGRPAGVLGPLVQVVDVDVEVGAVRLDPTTIGEAAVVGPGQIPPTGMAFPAPAGGAPNLSRRPFPRRND